MECNRKSAARLACATRWFAFLFILLFISKVVEGQLSTPRPIQAAETSALETVARYLATGTGALYGELSSDAPLRLLPKEEAIEEITARVGPRAGTVWKLQTIQDGSDERRADVAFRIRFKSGAEDALLFRMKRENNIWFIREIVTLGEPVVVATGEAQRVHMRSARIRTAVFAVAFVSLVLVWILRRQKVANAALAILAAAAIAPAIWLLLDRDAPERWMLTQVRDVPFVQLRQLVGVRAAIARGEKPSIPPGIPDDARAVAALWTLEGGGAIGAADPAALLGAAARSPAGEMVRGILAMARGNNLEARRAFDEVAVAKPFRDDVLLSVASVGDDAVLDKVDESLWELGSREAGVYYLAATELLMANNSGAARQAFETAWSLEPLPRADVVANPIYYYLYVDRAKLLSPREEVVIANDVASRTMALPAGARASVCGSFLRVEIGQSQLEIPNGAALAPRSAVAYAATEWHRMRDLEALRDAERMIADRSRLTGSVLWALRDRAAYALVVRGRWSDLLTLTEDIDADDDDVSPVLLRSRIIALLRSRRVEDAAALASGKTVAGLVERKDAPFLLLAIADAMMQAGRFDIAERLYRAIDHEALDEISANRLRRLEQRRLLAADSRSMPTMHFDLLYDSQADPAGVTVLADVMEKVYPQLDSRIPAGEFRRVKVNLLKSEEFAKFAGSDHILGLYDGEILAPYGGKPSSELFGTLTHELTHALVAAATNDKAPRWFQEGLAQYLEPASPDANRYFGGAVPVQVLDGFIGSPLDLAMVQHGYANARMFVCFLSERYPTAVPSLIRSFAAGKTTEEALAALTGRSADTLNVEYDGWVRSLPYDFRFPVTTTIPANDVRQTSDAPRETTIKMEWTRRPR